MVPTTFLPPALVLIATLSCVTTITSGWIIVVPNQRMDFSLAASRKMSSSSPPPSTTRLSFVTGNIPEEILRGRHPDDFEDAILHTDTPDDQKLEENLNQAHAEFLQQDQLLKEESSDDDHRHKISYHMLGSWHKIQKDPIVFEDEDDCEHPYFDRMTGDALCWGLFDDDQDEKALQEALDALDEDDASLATKNTAASVATTKKVWDYEIPNENFKPEDNHISYGMMGSWNKPAPKMESTASATATKSSNTILAEEDEEECEHPYFDQMTGDALCWFI